ncbi:MAG: polysaccharide biosynthesis/export family protein [Bacteroidetes bacterium]|nr:polysaccharide biosynthesis/export family protein [Bacteroidota bacterium]
MSRNFLFLIVITLTFTSCSSLKDTIYFQSKNPVAPTANKPTSAAAVHLLAVGDVINLEINTPLQTTAQVLGQKGGGTLIVNDNGCIEIPLVGVVKIAGLTLAMAKDTLIKQLKVFFNDPYVNLQLVSFKVTVFGEVGMPGIKALVSANATLLDALASSGDLTSFGNRSNIKVLRGETVYYLDLTDMNVFKSDGFFLQSNDIIYVQPLRKKSALANLSTSLTITSFVSFLVTLTTTIILLTK